MVKSGKTKSSGGKAAKSVETFDIKNPRLPVAIEDCALASGGYPYDKKLKREAFEAELEALQIELVKLQSHIAKRRERIVIVFEGRDAAGKGTCISHLRAYLNPRSARVVALTKPSEIERGQWYFLRYAAHLPSAGEMVLFDRSWYNRAGVERVMGYADPDQIADFLREAPQFEGMLVRDGIKLFKIFLELGREMQLKRFHERWHDPLKRWKITDIDLAAVKKWDDYTTAKEEMLRFTHTAVAPWSVILSNDQRRARLESIRLVLDQINYEGKDAAVVGTPDLTIVGSSPEHFYRRTPQG